MDRIAQAASVLAGAFLLRSIRRASSKPPVHPDGPPLEVSPELGYKHRKYHGIPQPGFWVARVVDDLRQNFELDSQDVVIATYPKCGVAGVARECECAVAGVGPRGCSRSCS